MMSKNKIIDPWLEDQISNTILREDFSKLFINYVLKRFRISKLRLAQILKIDESLITIFRRSKRPFKENNWNIVLTKILDKYPINLETVVYDFKQEAVETNLNTKYLLAYTFNEHINELEKYTIQINPYKKGFSLIRHLNNQSYIGFYQPLRMFNLSPAAKNRKGEIQIIFDNLFDVIKNKNKVLFGLMNFVTSKNIGSKNIIIYDLYSSPPKDIAKISELYLKEPLIQPYINRTRLTRYSTFSKSVKEYYSNHQTLSIKLPKILLTAYQQFLLYFTEYVNHAKGYEIRFDVIKKHEEESLEINIDTLGNIDLISVNEFLQEYLELTQKTNEISKINIENNISDHEFNLLIVDLKNQINTLNRSLEVVSIRNNILVDQVEYLRKLSLEFAKKNNVINTQIIEGGNQQFADRIENKNKNNED